MTTQKGNSVYVHVLDWQDAVLALPKAGAAGELRLVPEGRPAGDVHRATGRAAAAPRPRRADPIDTIVVLELEPQNAVVAEE